MDLKSRLKKQIKVSSGEQKASLVLKNAVVVNVFTNELEHLDIAIEDDMIVGLGLYEGISEIDLCGAYACPGFLDGHIHLESSMVSPREFQSAVLPHGTTGVVTDPHEIANVAGSAGIRYMMECAKKLSLDVYFMMPSCVPSTSLDESGAVLEAQDLEEFYGEDQVLGLAELMDFYGTIDAKEGILNKIQTAHLKHKLIDGHAPGLNEKGLNAYITAGVQSDHECSDLAEALEKMRRGQWIMIREGTAAKNMNALMPLFQPPYCSRAILVTDDKHPGDLIRLGHMDYIIRTAVEKGANPVHAVRMATINTAHYFGLKQRGAIAPGYKADITVVSDLKSFEVKWVFKDGKLAAEHGVCLVNDSKINGLKRETAFRVFDSFHLKEITEKDLVVKEAGTRQRVLCLTPNELITTQKIVPWAQKEGFAPGVDVDQDIVKMAVFERHQNTGHVGLGFLGGYGLKHGAVASSIAHDSHNLIIAGTNDRDMVIAGNLVRKNKGGLAVVVNGEIIGELALPIAGLMSELTAGQVEEKLEFLKQELRKMGIPHTIDPFMTLAFTSLPVIPQLRLNTYGLIDVPHQKVIDVVF